MENKQKILLGAALIVLLAVAAWFGKDWLPGGKQSAAKPEALIEQALEITGTLRGIEQMPEQMNSSRDMLGESPGQEREIRRSVAQAMAESFPVEGFKKRIRATFRADYNEDHLRAIIDAAEEPEIQRLIAMETAGQPSPEEFMAFMAKFQQSPPPQARLEILQHLDQAAGLSRQSAEIGMGTARALLRGMAAATGKPMDEAERSLNEVAGQLENSMRQGIQLSLAYVYREASDEDLQDYVALYDTPHGKWYVDKVFQALREEFQAGSERLAKRLPELIKSAQLPRVAPQESPAAAEAAAPAPISSAAARVDAQAAAQADASEPAPAIRPHRRWHQDARECLSREGNREIMGCAERYY